MRLRSIFVSVATIGLMVGPAFVHGVFDSVAGARKDCTITGTAADDDLTGTTRGDVICTKAGSDSVDALEGNDVIRGGQGDDNGGEFGGLCGGDGSDRRCTAVKATTTSVSTAPTPAPVVTRASPATTS